LRLHLPVAGGPELDSGSHPSLLTRWMNWSGARGCGVMLTKSSRDRPACATSAAVGHRVPAVPAPRPVSLRHHIQRLRRPRSVEGVQLRWIELVVGRLASSGSKLFKLVLGSRPSLLESWVVLEQSCGLTWEGRQRRLAS
jgi:hypothetical protein